MKKYKLTDNISFLASVMRQASKASFVFVLLRIPLEVIIPYIGIWFPNLIVRAIEESVNRTQLFTQAAVLGGLFGLTSLINNTTQPGITSFCFSPFIELGDGMGGSPLSLIICFVPRILCGIVPFYVYNLIQSHAKNKEKTRKVSLLAAGVAGSMTNTILVMSMIYIFFGAQYAEARSIAFEAVLGVILSVVGINGTIEAVIAAMISAAVSTALLKSRFTRKF